MNVTTPLSSAYTLTTEDRSSLPTQSTSLPLLPILSCSQVQIRPEDHRGPQSLAKAMTICYLDAVSSSKIGNHSFLFRSEYDFYRQTIVYITSLGRHVL